MRIEGYTKTIASTATPVSAKAPSGTIWTLAKEVIIRCPAGNTSDIKIGSRIRQEFTIAKGTNIEIREVNRAGQSGKIELAELFIKAGTNNDTVEILLVDPSND